MSVEQTSVAAVAQRRKRPLFVWIMTIFDSLFAGVFLLAACFRLYANPTFSGVEYPMAQIVFWGILGLGICTSAQLAWYGSRYARNTLLALMTIYLGLAIWQNIVNFVWVSNSAFDQEPFIRQQVLETARSILWLAANFWFLRGRRAKGFYS